MFFNLFSPVAPDPSVPYVPGVSNVAFTIGSLSIDWYGIFITIGFVLAIVLSILKLKL
jgi:prolipoprotein diacylglyceryltransferase